MPVWSRTVGIAVVGLALMPALAHGDESLGDSQYWEAQDKLVKDRMDAANTKCGTSMTFEWINKPLLKSKGDGGNNGTPSGMCGSMFDSLYYVCADSNAAKAKVAQKVKSVACGYADTRALTLVNGKLTVMTNNKSPPFDPWARAQLGTKL